VVSAANIGRGAAGRGNARADYVGELWPRQGERLCVSGGVGVGSAGVAADTTVVVDEMVLGKPPMR